MLSIILLSYYSKNRIPEAFFKVREIMEANDIPFEFIVMDDGSKDESYAVALELERKYKNVRAYQLSRNYSSTYSAFAGLSVCLGDCATIIVDDEQQPYSTLVEMYRIWEKGEKAIIPYRTKRNDGFITTCPLTLTHPASIKFLAFSRDTQISF